MSASLLLIHNEFTVLSLEPFWVLAKKVNNGLSRGSGESVVLLVCQVFKLHTFFELSNSVLLDFGRSCPCGDWNRDLTPTSNKSNRLGRTQNIDEISRTGFQPSVTVWADSRNRYLAKFLSCGSGLPLVMTEATAEYEA